MLIFHFTVDFESLLSPVEPGGKRDQHELWANSRKFYMADAKPSPYYITIYLDTEKRQSYALCTWGHKTVERFMKKINKNPQHYEHETCVIIHIVWKSHVCYIVLCIFIIAVLLTSFFLFIPWDVWLRDIWLYLCIGLSSFILLGVIIYYILQYCDKSRWTANELNRINDLIHQSNQYGVEPQANDHWTDYCTDSEDDNPNNVYTVRLVMEPISNHERREYVIKIQINIHLAEINSIVNVNMNGIYCEEEAEPMLP